MNNATNPQTGLAGGALPFDTTDPDVLVTFYDGRSFARELLAYLVRLDGLSAWPVESRQAMQHAALCGFLSPLLPLLAESLALFGGDVSSGQGSSLFDDLIHGAGLALERMDYEGET